MVLQRDKPIEVWGFDAPASSSALTIHYGANAVEAYWPVAADGSWRAVLPALPGAPCNSTALVLKARGVTVQSLSDVCIGDLHLFAGQSNIDIGESYANQFSPVAQVLLPMHAARCCSQCMLLQHSLRRSQCMPPSTSGPCSHLSLADQSQHEFAAV
jgi:hypothetical protein